MTNQNDEDEEKLRKEMEKDIKCVEKFSESTLISVNANLYRPKSIQPLHRKSFSFNSPHLMGSFLKNFNESKNSKQNLGVGDDSFINETEKSFVNLEDKSFLLANRYA